MNSYVICTDSACDILPSTLAKWGIPFLPLTLRFDGEETEYKDTDIPSETFYKKMREGAVAKTSAINTESFKAFFEEHLQTGLDVLYIGFSSGLSTTFNCARLAAAELSEKYPDRKIIVVDSLAASAGEGLLLYLVNEKKNSGATIEDAAAYAEEIKLSVCHWFTVDDLVYLKRGGRISSASALVGSILSIKPVLHVDNDGHLINVSKVRGRRSSILALAEKYAFFANDPEGGTVFISHSDCIEDAEYLANVIKEKHGAEVKIITNVGTVIGAHSGPGTLALFFIGKER